MSDDFVNDDFSKAYRELLIMTSEEEYSVYRYPYTNEVAYYQGELPLKIGLPPEIEDGTPEALEYKQKQIEVYGMPGQFLDDNFIKQKKEGRQEEVVNDKAWIRASKILHKYMANQNRNILYTRDDENEEKLTTDKDFAEWGIDYMSSFENNFTNMLIDTNKLDGAPAPVAAAMYYLLETSDRKGILLDNFINGLYYTAMDYSNLVGLATLGVGLIGRQGGKQMTKVAFREYLKNLVTRKPDAAEMALGVEGMTYMMGFDYGAQTARMRADKQEEYNLGQTATMGATGAVAGPVLGRTLEAAGTGVKRVVEKGMDLVKPEERALKSITPILDITETKKIENIITKKQADNLFSAITKMKDDDGFSITLDGKTPEDLGFKKGYMLAPLKQTELKFDAKEFDMNDLAELAINVKALDKALEGSEGQVYAGAWKNPDTQQFELDASIRVDNLDKALYIARAGNQYGIFNLENFDLVFTIDGLKKLKASGTYDIGQQISTKGTNEQLSKKFTESRLEIGGEVQQDASKRGSSSQTNNKDIEVPPLEGGE